MTKNELLKYMVNWLEEIQTQYEEQILANKVIEAEIDMLEHLIGKFSND